MFASIVSVASWGLPLGIDFTGGSVLDIRNVDDRDSIDTVLGEFVDSYSVRNIGNESTDVSIRLEEIDEETRLSIMSRLEETNPNIEQIEFDKISATIGSETKNRSLVAIALVLIAILVYIAFAFSRLSYPIASWQYGVVTLIALCHDLIISIGVVALFVSITGAEIGVAFIAALLMVLGYSVNDTIVIFDRVRENLRKSSATTRFDDVVARSVNETVVRSINSSLTTIIVLASIFIFSGESLALFMVTLITGVVIGTYSSLAIASSLVVDMAKKR